MNFRQSRRSEELSLNLTPLIDIVFLLLIFFMVTTTFDQNSSLDINLPKTSTTAQQQPSKMVELVIDQTGQHFVNGVAIEVLTQQKLRDELAAHFVDRAKALIIKADAQTPHQAVVSAMEAAHDAGFTQLKVAAEQGNTRIKTHNE